MRDTSPRICLIAQSAYGALARVDTGRVGGIETQTSLMARWLAARGYPISMITWDEGQPEGIDIDGVRVHKMCAHDAGISGLRFLHPKWTSLYKAMRRANADVYYYNCGDLGLGQVVLWCRRHGRKTVYGVASNPDCDPRLPVLKPWRERVLYRYGLLHVDSVIVQTQHQRQMLREGFGVDSTVIPMPCAGFDAQERTAPSISGRESTSALWVGRISAEKRFELLLDMAEQCPQITFDVVGASNTDSDYALRLAARAAGVANVRMHGRVPHAEIAKYYRQSRVLCCTSAYEGFPNTFLEAWSCGIPVVSTFDPDGVVAQYGLGWTASTMEGLVRAFQESMTESAKWHAASKAAREYYLKNHTLDSCMEQFARVFRETSES